MIINCPRCGFSQPKDQYCAQCGVDMQSFKPKSIPVAKKIFQSTTTHVVLLLAGAAFVGQYVIRSEEPQRWVQKITRSQGVTKSKAKFDNENESSGIAESASEADDPNEQLASLKNKELAVNANVEQPIPVGSNASSAFEGNQAGSTQNTLNTRESNLNEPTFKTLYAEVATSTVSRWIADSSNAGQYQNLQEYSAGILPEFSKRMDTTIRVLKSTEKKLGIGQGDSQLSGTVGDNSGQMIGLAANIEFRSQENGNIHGTIGISRMQRQNRDNFPAEFDLPKGSAFFILGTIRPDSFPAEREILNMPPFQIFKSPDFAARKTEFVIILEAENR